MRHVGHNSLCMVGILAYKADITVHVTKRNEKKMNGKKTTESSNCSWFKFWQIYTWLWNVLLKQIIAPEQINMSFAFTYIKSQAKQFSALWDLLSFSPSVFLAFSVFHSRLHFIRRISWLSVPVLKLGVPLIYFIYYFIHIWINEI